MENIKNYWEVDGNYWSKSKYSEDRARELAKTLKDCKNCIDCSYCKDCESCTNCHHSENCKNCIDCICCENCGSCVECMYCESIQDCTEHKWNKHTKKRRSK